MAMPAKGIFPGHMQPYPAVRQHLCTAHVLTCMSTRLAVRHVGAKWCLTSAIACSTLHDLRPTKDW
jgi:hypothetical protein